MISSDVFLGPEIKSSLQIFTEFNYMIVFSVGNGEVRFIKVLESLTLVIVAVAHRDFVFNAVITVSEKYVVCHVPCSVCV